jgi:ankyrin repeat protein
MTGVHLAAYFGLGKSISTLLERPHNINLEDEDGRTPLSWAAEKGHRAVVKLLLDKNADVEAKNIFGRTPLSWATEKGRVVTKLLLDKNADVKSNKNKSGQTPLS